MQFWRQDDDYIDDDDTSHFEDAEEMNASEAATAELDRREACLATFRSPDIRSGDEPPEICYSHKSSQPCRNHSEAEASSTDGSMHEDLFDCESASKTGSGIEDSQSKSCEGKPCPEALDITCDRHEHSMSDCDGDQEDIGNSLQHNNCSDYIFQHLSSHSSRVPSDSSSGDDSSSKTPRICDEDEFKTPESVYYAKVMPRDSMNSCSDSDISTFNTQTSTDLTGSHKCEVGEKFGCVKDSSKDYIALSDRKCYSPSSAQFHDSDVAGASRELPSSIGGESLGEESQDFTSASRTNHQPRTSQSEDILQPSNHVCHQSVLRNCPSDLLSQYSVTSVPTNHQKLDESPQPCPASINSNSFSNAAIIAVTVSQESNLSTQGTANCSFNQSILHESYTQSNPRADKYKESVQGEEEHSAVDSCEQSNELNSEPCTKEIAQRINHSLDYSQPTEDEEVSPYKQHISNDTEEMETDAVEDDDVTRVPVNSDIYQSYEDVGYQIVSTDEAALPGIAQYDTSDNQTPEVTTQDGTTSSSSTTLSGSSPTPNGEAPDVPSTCVVTESTVSEATISSAEDPVSTSTSSSPSLSTQQPLGQNNGDQEERVFSQTDQAFMSATARQQNFLPAGLSYVPGMNPSMYTGAAMVQGMAGPTVMTSSSVHIAQHPGGATIMQHRHMSAGINGGMSQATVMQQQAMHNGVQATSVMQRTLTNGGQTMVVQQRTMTTGLDGMTQQTVVQQQVAAPNMAQAAMYHANAMRQRQLVTQQQANMMQQRGIRLVQTGVMGGPMMQQHHMGGATLLQGGGMAPAALIQHGLLRGMSQGAMMQQIVRQRYLGGPVMPGRGVQLMAGRPIRVKMTYPRESMQMDT